MPPIKRNRDQETEQREAGNRLTDVGESQRPPARERMGSQQHPGRYRNGRRNQDRAEHQHQMLAEQLHAFVEQVLQKRHRSLYCPGNPM